MSSAATESVTTPSDLPTDFSIDDFADIISLMSRFLSRFANSDPFKEADLGLAEWLGLMTIRSKTGLSNKQFAKLVGTTPQRAAQISDVLKSVELISENQSAQDARMHSLSVTASGLERLDQLNSKLTPMICSSLDGKTQLVPRIRKHLNMLLRIVTPPKADRRPEQVSAE